MMAFESIELLSWLSVKAHGTKEIVWVVDRLDLNGFKTGFFGNGGLITEPFTFYEIFTPSKVVEDDKSLIVRDTEKLADLSDFVFNNIFYIIESNKNDGFLDYMN